MKMYTPATVVEVVPSRIGPPDRFDGRRYDTGNFVRVREDASGQSYVLMNGSINACPEELRVVEQLGFLYWDRNASHSLPMFTDKPSA
jgi:hypothetical protein